MLKRAGGILLRQETWIYLLLAFPLIDYTLRNLLPIPLVSSLWDEGVLLVLLLFTAWRFLETGRPLPGLIKPLGALMAMGLAYLVLDIPFLAASLEGFRATFQYMIAFFIGFYFLRSKEELLQAIRVLVLVGALVGLYGLFQYVAGVETPASWVGAGEAIRTRIFSIVQSPNVLGSQMAFLLPMALALLAVERSWLRRGFWAGVTLVLLAALLLTFSRGAWLAFAGAIGVLSVLFDRRLLVVGLILAILVPVLVPQVGDRVTQVFSQEYLEKAARDGRIARWLGAYDQMRNEPLFGRGLGHYGGAVAARNFGTTYVDSYYFKTLAETGLLGLGLFLWLIAYLALDAFRVWRQAAGSKYGLLLAGLFGGLLAVILHNGVENIFEVPYMNTYFWLVAGFLLSYPYLGESREQAAGIAGDERKAAGRPAAAGSAERGEARA